MRYEIRDCIAVRLFSLFLMISISWLTTKASVQQVIPPPAGSGEFGTFVAFLPNGNIIVTDPLFDAPGPIANVGAVHLFDGTTLALIASLTGSVAEDRVSNLGVTVLPNGNYVVRSTLWGATDVGAVTFCNMAGCNGAVSAANSLVGGSTADNVGNLDIVVLSDGDFVVRSTNWDKPSPTVSNVGATTFCSATTGCPIGLVTATNSLIGSTASDFVGNGGINALSNGNYVVRSSNWDNAAPVASNAGAVTFCNGTAGCTGAVSSANSLVGVTASDQVGSSGVTALADGDYVVASSSWDNTAPVTANVGAATFCNGATGCTGTISPTNSLVGTVASDLVGGSGVTELANGNYLVNSAGWDNPAPSVVNAGASTWCNGASGCTGAVTSSNSLFGSTNGDFSAILITALPNGNYVVRNLSWDNGAATNAGAATFCPAAGCTGAVSAANSLVGSTTNDNISSGGVAFHDTSHYAVASPNWDNGAVVDAGMVAFCSGATGCIGSPDLSNSEVVKSPSSHFRYQHGATSGDHWGNGGVVPMNYPVKQWGTASPEADVNGVVDAGIAARCELDGCNTGAFSPTDGVWGTTTGDNVSKGGIVTWDNDANDLTPENLRYGRRYAVVSPNWNKGGISQAGSVAFCDAGSPTSCKNVPVSTGIGPTGSFANDCLGGDCSGTLPEPGVNPLDKWNFGINCPDCDIGGVTDAGAAMHCGCYNNYCRELSPDPTNALVGSTTGDQDEGTITTFPNGRWRLRFHRWDNTVPIATDAGTVVYGGSHGSPTGLITSANAAVGTVSRTNPILEAYADDSERGRFAWGKPSVSETIVSRTKFESGLGTGAWNAPPSWDLSAVPQVWDDAVISHGSTVNIDGIFRVNSVKVEGTGNLIGSSPTTFVESRFTVDFLFPRTVIVPSGITTNGNRFTPVTLAVTNVAQTPSSLTVDTCDEYLPGLDPSESVSYAWGLDETGDLTGDFTFRYPDADVNGNEATFRVFKSVNGLTPVPVTPFSLDTAANTITALDVSGFSDWGIGNLSPTAAGVPVGGRVFDNSHRAVARARVRILNGSGVLQTAVTSSFGYFRFHEIPVGETYIIEVVHKRYAFSPQVVTISDEIVDLNFIGVEN